MTDFLNFTQDPDRDIITAPQDYHDFNGKAVRLKVYWTTDIWKNFNLWSQSLHLLSYANTVLRKYTLKLDVMPYGVPADVHAAMRAKMAKAVGPKIMQTVRRIPDSVRSVADDILDQTIDDVATTIQGLINYTGSINVPYEGTPAIEELQSLRTFIEPVVEESRLIVVFVPLSGPANGYTSLFGQWLPWILADPRSFDAPVMLLHEIGHACRLAHQQGNVRIDDIARRNLMYDLSTKNERLWGWQVDTIFDSYWCAGKRPKNWWIRKPLLPEGHPFLWEEDP
jgi:hypothetical protein